jgi:diguanylate cyclase (GGDEF)-like protein/PAS domain S-box-containing protein
VFRLDPERAQNTLDAIGDAVISVDQDGLIDYLNAAAENMTGWPRQEARGRRCQEVLRIVDGVSRAPAANLLALALLQGPAGLSPNSVLISRDGREFAIEDSAAPIRDRRGLLVGAVMVFRDVGVARSLAQQMFHQARHDTLTGLPNRLLMEERLAHALATAHRHRRALAVLYLDLDGFKRVNDSLGHEIGDLLLQSVARRLVACVRASDTVCRQGGDEFVVLLEEMNRPEDAAGIAAKMLADAQLVHHIGAHELHAALSIGIGLYPADGTDARTLLKNADVALLRAKLQGGGALRLFGGMAGPAVPGPAVYGAAHTDLTLPRRLAP